MSKLPVVRNVLPFDVDSKEAPQTLKMVLRSQIRDLFSRRNVFKDCILSNAGLDEFISRWWTHHQNIIRAASIRNEWDWNNLCLHFTGDVARSVNLYKCMKDYYTLIGMTRGDDGYAMRHWNYSRNEPVYDSNSDFYLGRTSRLLYECYSGAFVALILEDKTVDDYTQFTADDAYISVERAEQVKTLIDNATTEDRRGAFITKGINKLLEKEDIIPFNKLPKEIYNYILTNMDNEAKINEFFDSFRNYLEEHVSEFWIDLYKSIGAHQLNGGKGMLKSTVCNKLIKSYYDWLACTSLGTELNPLLVAGNSFEKSVETLKANEFYTEEYIKVRSDSEGYRLSNSASFNVIFARMMEYAKGSIYRESFIVSFHPCDMITCSLGYNWSSCQSWIDNFEDLPKGYGVGTSYSGMYNRGNFQFACANGFIVYIPHEKLEGVPQYMWAKLKRCLVWINDDLSCMRQNNFYPGKPTDEDTLALGKTIREYLQDVCAPFNFTNGTIDWKVVRGRGSNAIYDMSSNELTRIHENYTYTGGRYDDPILAVAYLKKLDKDVNIEYANDFPRFDTGITDTSARSYTKAFFKEESNVCPVCGKHSSHEGYCTKCSKELVQHNGKLYHPSDLFITKINGEDKMFDIDELDNLKDMFVNEDGVAVEFKSAYKVFMPSGIKYFKVLPDYVKECKVCHQYFHSSFMIGDICIEHFNEALAKEDSEVEFTLEEVLEKFIKGTLSFDCNDTDNLIKLLNMLDEKNIVWASRAKASAYIPQTDSAKKMYLSLTNGRLVLSCRAKSTVIKVSNLFKGGN